MAELLAAASFLPGQQASDPRDPALVHYIILLKNHWNACCDLKAYLVQTDPAKPPVLDMATILLLDWI
jgi:hypothetical protein